MIVGVKVEEVKEVRNLALEGVVLALKRANRNEGSAGSRLAGTSVGRGGDKRAGKSTGGVIVDSGRLIVKNLRSLSVLRQQCRVFSA